MESNGSVCWTHVNVMKIVITHSYNDEGAVIFFREFAF